LPGLGTWVIKVICGVTFSARGGEMEKTMRFARQLTYFLKIKNGFVKNVK
jgi:hypothetical protein